MKLNKNGCLNIRKANGAEVASVVVTGDFCPRAAGEELILKGRAADIIEPVMDIFRAADLSVMQFETALTTADTPIVKSGPNLRCNPEVVDMLREWGGDVTLLANNHTGDFGPEALMNTIDILHSNGFKTVGAGANIDEAYKPLVCDACGIKVGILNVAENEFGSASFDKPGAAPLNPCLNIRQIMDLSQKVDVCMVITHGGNEQNPIPSPRVVDMSRAFAAAGADIVINIHTHCPQGYEVFGDSLIIYSLGNFYFPWPKDRAYSPQDFWCNGYVARIDIDAKGCFAFTPIPVTFDATGGTYIKTLTTAQNAAFYKYLDKISAPIADRLELQKYHEAWAASSYYTHFLHEYPYKEEDFQAPAPNPKLMALRNIFTCEAHNELVRTYLRLVEEGRLKDALKYKKKIEALSKATYVKE